MITLWLNVWVYRISICSYDASFAVRLGQGTTQTARAHKCLSDLVGVAVGRGTTVLHVTLALIGRLSRNANAAGARRYTVAEALHARRLVFARQTTLIVLAALRVVVRNVLKVHLGQLLNGRLDGPALP